MQDPRKTAAKIGGQREEPQGGRGLGCGTMWRSREYKGVNEVNTLPSTPCTPPTHLHGHKGEEFTGEIQCREQGIRCITGGGSRTNRGVFSSTHWRNGRYPAAFRERKMQ